MKKKTNYDWWSYIFSLSQWQTNSLNDSLLKSVLKLSCSKAISPVVSQSRFCSALTSLLREILLTQNIVSLASRFKSNKTFIYFDIRPKNWILYECLPSCHFLQVAQQFLRLQFLPKKWLTENHCVVANNKNRVFKYTCMVPFPVFCSHLFVAS